MKELTGDYRFRNEGELLALQVEESEYTHSTMDGSNTITWRDAKTEDLLKVEFNKQTDKFPPLFEIPPKLGNQETRWHHHKEN